ncbi:MAG: NAD(P)-dependent oxidoreductase [Bacteroidales bacterium]
MKKILLATDKPFAVSAVDGIREIIQEAGYEMILLEKYSSHEQFVEVAKSANALIVRSDIVDKALITAASKLEIVVRAGAGYDNIELPACTEKGIVVMNTPGQNANAVAELVAGLMIYMVRNGFNGSSGTELRNKKLGIHAYGYVGRIVGMIGKGLGMKVYAHDPFVDRIIIENDGIKVEPDVNELYRKCQVVSLHLPLTKNTRESINWNLLSEMPEDALLINTARKEIINEKDLLRMLAERPDFRYASDIVPDAGNEILAKFPGRCFFTPKKMGAQTFEANVNAGLAAARQIVNFFKSGDTSFKVN